MPSLLAAAVVAVTGDLLTRRQQLAHRDVGGESLSQDLTDGGLTGAEPVGATDNANS
ncbi:hypothetical protein [Mycobacterium sp. URHB0021]